MKKYFLSILLATFLVVMFQPLKAEAAENTAGGTFGETLTWEYENGTLTISGKGYTSHFSAEKYPPWYYIRNEIHTIVVEEGVVFLGDRIFLEHNNVTKVQLHSGITSIGIKAFQNCYKLEEINIPDGVTFIGEKAFYGCTSLKKITIPNTVTDMGRYVFYNCTSLESVTLSNSLRRIEQSSFRQCKSLTSVTLPKSVYHINEYAFSGCENLKKVAIFGNIEKIDYNAFEGCESLESLDLSASLSFLGDSAFLSCKTIKEIRFHGDMPEMGNGVFALAGHEDFLCNLYYPANNKTWSQEKLKEELGNLICYFQLVPYGTLECDHKVVKVNGKAATCTEKGLTEKQYCSECNKTLKEQSTIKALGHDYEIITVKSTCTEAGYDLHRCTRCQKEERRNEQPTTEHSFGEWKTTKEATVEEAGMQIRSCIHCKEQQNQEIPALTESTTEGSTMNATEISTEQNDNQGIDQDVEQNNKQDIDNTQESFSQRPWKLVVPLTAILLIAAIFFIRQHIKKNK